MKYVALLSCLVAAACMNNGGDDTSSTTVGRAQAPAAGNAMAAGVESSAQMYGPVNPGSGVDAGCVVAGGDPSDPDGDYIPANATLTYNCSASLLGYNGTLTGTLHATDTNPVAVAWAFDAGADLHATLTGPGGGGMETDWNGNFVASQQSGFGPYLLDRNLDVVTTFTPGSGGDGGEALGGPSTVTETAGWNITYTPTVSWVPGQVVVGGNLGATGTWDVDVDGKTAQATLATPTPLTIASSCATLVTAGTVTATYPDENQVTNTITVTWTGCGVHRTTHTP